LARWGVCVAPSSHQSAQTFDERLWLVSQDASLEGEGTTRYLLVLYVPMNQGATFIYIMSLAR
jgi:hypothetical protein